MGVNMQPMIPVLLVLLFYGVQNGASLECDFEVDQCGWEQVASDDFDWTRYSGPTPTMPTGPDVDHTLGTALGHYMYTEASWPQSPGDYAIMRSPDIVDLASTDINVCFTFWYHMFGLNIGTLSLYFTTSSTSMDQNDLVWAKSDEQGNRWIEAEIRVTDFISTSKSGYFAFEGRISSYTADMALDDITLGPCSARLTTTQPTTTTQQTTTYATTTSATTTPPTTTKATTAATTTPPHTTTDATTTRATTTQARTTKATTAATTTQPHTTTDATTTRATTTQATTTKATTAATTTQPHTTTDATTTRATTTQATTTKATTAATTTQPHTTTDATTTRATTTQATTTLPTILTTTATTSTQSNLDTTTVPESTTPLATTTHTTTDSTTIPETSTPETTNEILTTPKITTPAKTTTPDETSPETTNDILTTPEITTPAKTTSPGETTPETTPETTNDILTTPEITTPAKTTSPGETTPETTNDILTTPKITTPSKTTTPTETTSETSSYITTIQETTTPAETTPETITDIKTTPKITTPSKTTTPTETTSEKTTDSTTIPETTFKAETTTAVTDDCSQSNIGKRFVFAFPRNRELGSENNFVVISTSSPQVVNVVVNEFNGNTFSGEVTASMSRSFSLTENSRCTGSGLQNCAVRVSADGDISVIGYSESGPSVGNFLAIPVGSLGDDYIVASYRPTDGYYSEFTVTAADTAAQVTVEFPELIRNDRSGNGLTEDLQFQLDAGQTYQVRSALDLSASRVTSTAPVSVISGVSCAEVPWGLKYCDYLVEQMPPVNTLGSSFTVSTYHGRPESGFDIRIIATHDNTYITSDVVNTIIHAFEYIDPTAETFVAFDFDTSEPVLVVQYQRGIYADYLGEPSMSIISPKDQYSVGAVTFPVVDSFASSNYVDIIVAIEDEGGIQLDGVPLDSVTDSRNTTKTSTVWGKTLTGGLHTVSHADPDVPFSVVTYGYDNYIGYGTTAGTLLMPSYCRQTTTTTATTTQVTTDTTTTDATTTGTVTTDATTTVGSTTADPPADGSSSGTSFAFAFPTNQGHTANTQTYLIFTTTSSGAVTVVVTGYTFSSSFSMDASAEYMLRIEPIPLSVGSGLQNSTVVIEASDEVSIQGRSVDGISLEVFTPISNTGLGTEYVIASYPPLATADYHSQFTLTTGEAGSTHVTVRFSQDYEYTGEVYNRINPLELDLGSHETVQFQSLIDLTGSSVSSTRPVSVVSGDSCAQVPVDVEFCNYLVEQLPPVTRWGKNVVFTGFYGRTSGTIIRIMVSLSGANVNVQSRFITAQTFSSSTASYFDLDIGLNTDPISITADNPILVLMYHKSVYTDYIGDPSMTIVPAVEQWTSGKVTFFVVDLQSPQADDHISIAIETVNEVSGVLLDDQSVSTATDVETLRHGIYTIYRLSISTGYHTVEHQDATIRFSVLVYGTNIYNSYAYPARMDLPLTS